MNQPLVSFGLPAFKGAHFAEALRSIKNQTYRNIEVIVQDDASPDDLKSIFDAEVGDDPRFTYDRNEKNTAPYFVKNWQKTIDKAKGEFFVLAGDDDLYESDFIEELVALSQKYPKTDLFFGWQNIFDKNGTKGIPLKVPEYQSQVEWLRSAIVEERQYQAQCALVRLSAIKLVGGFVDLPAAWPSDLVTWTKLSGNGVVSSQKVLMHWRHDGQNISAQNSEYWSLLKIKASLQVHAGWLKLISAAQVGGGDEQLERQMVLNKMQNGYLPWLVYSEFHRLTLSGLIKALRMLVDNHKLSYVRAMRMIAGRVRRNVFNLNWK